MLSLSIARVLRPTWSIYKTPLSRSIMSPARDQKILVAVVGVGLVGSELINQLLSIPPQVSPFKLVSLTSSSRSLFTGKVNPIQPNAPWKSQLAASSDPADLKALTARLAQLVAENERVALVDNTSSDVVANLYPVWLKEGINVVTPNKKAFSGDAELFANILSASRESGARFLNEATVGAGLPVIAPLKELLATGDKVCNGVSFTRCKINFGRSSKSKVSSPGR
jgi:homoserine dehydrogenase